jgi:hypothetical protein
MTPLEDFRRLNDEVTYMAPLSEIYDIKNVLSKLANADEVIQKFEDNKSHFEQQIHNFVARKDFNETFQSIGKSLESFQETVKSQGIDSMRIKENIKIIIDNVSKKSDRVTVESEMKRVWAKFKEFCSYEHLQKYKDNMTPIITNSKYDIQKCLKI